MTSNMVDLVLVTLYGVDYIATKNRQNAIVANRQ